MASSATQSTSGSGRPLLIAVAGLGPRTGVTTTTVALARAWPGPEPAVVVEADPRGGQLAQLAGTDPYLGLASVAHAAHTGAGRVRLADHLRFLPGGVGFLAAPPGPDPARTTWVTTLLTGRHHDRRLTDLAAWNDLGATVFADCGAPGPGSTLAPLLAAADACLIVVDADRADPAPTGPRIRELADRSRHPGVLVIGADPGSEYASALQVPVLAGLPREHHSAATLLYLSRPRPRRNPLLLAARAVAAAIEAQLRPPPPAPSHTDRGNLPTRIPGRRASVRPRVYRLELPAAPPPEPSRTVPTPDPAQRPPPRGQANDTPQRRRSAASTDPADMHGTGSGDSASRHEPETDKPVTTSRQRPAAPRDPAGLPGRGTALPVPLGAQSPVSGTDRTVPGTTDSDIGSGGKDSAVGASEPESAVPTAPVPVLSVKVFGPLTVLWRPRSEAAPVEITRSLRPRERELLTLLAVHPAGATRDAMIEALWPDHTSPRPGNTLNTVVSRLRKALNTAVADIGTDIEFIENDSFRFRLTPGLWDVDYVVFDQAVTVLRTTTSVADRERACRTILDTADGILGEELTADWIVPIREHARRDRLRALGKLASMLVGTDPDQTLALLETALVIDPTNEPIYQDILRLYARLGERTVINPTIALLKRRLESIGDIPTQQTLDIARTLRDHHTG
ncbi:winged helix-turn-helix domain-containing protein [Nocardia wallacei]|uniref:winged helix-turn-helix domain-containing protein n=1 Tax=Nocardia wallacei TaxID=480035 RepID=UPI002456D9A4|nr:winged helix-turn-helix domain-containing protein [Nocardia wallacei]